MCSFVFSKETHMLLDTSPVTWHSIGAVSLCKAMHDGTDRVPHCLTRMQLSAEPTALPPAL